mmetsp:Transcript_24110/g.53899  ORF Transcript_24110/g.53899 Transcript_24110/m.53899 type:complete len:80 (-) Transcript_24110:103-342(-)
MYRHINVLKSNFPTNKKGVRSLQIAKLVHISSHTYINFITEMKPKLPAHVASRAPPNQYLVTKGSDWNHACGPPPSSTP